MTSWHSYPKIYNLGHAVIADLLQGSVIVEEKIDGSQLSFGVFDGQLKMRSKNVEFDFVNGAIGGKMFSKAVEYVKSVQHLLVPGWTYRGEYLQAPAHNALTYDRTPRNFIMLFDVAVSEELYLDPDKKRAAAAAIGLECVPCYAIKDGTTFTYDRLQAFLEQTSVLGGQKIEGVVIKNYSRFGEDKKILLGKFVSEAFKEVHKATWKQGEQKTPSRDKIALLGERYRTPARWNKAIQHLRDAGKLTESLADIGPLLKEISSDIHSECVQEIQQELFKMFWSDISKIVTKGFPQWYKEQLANK